ncbi:unnamed protein product [Cunninghamella echinulata]
MSSIRIRFILRRVLIASLSLMVLLAVIVPTLHFYLGEGRQTILIDYKNEHTQNQSLIMNATLLDVDFEKMNYLIHFNLQPNGTLANSQGLLMHETVISFSPFQKFVYYEGDPLSSLQVTLRYDDGNPIDYPFDRYTGYFEMDAYIKPSSNASSSPLNESTNGRQSLPISFNLDASLTSFSFTPTFTPLNQRLGLKILTGRSTTTLGFSLFMCILMWALSLIMAMYGYQVLMHKRPVHAHACMLGITMLFALPALRSSQPGIPNVGCISDILGFYWNMAIIALESITILICWVTRWDSKDSTSSKIRNEPKQMDKIDHIDHFEHIAAS